MPMFFETNNVNFLNTPDPVVYRSALNKILLRAQDICPDTFNDRELPTEGIVHYIVGAIPC